MDHFAKWEGDEIDQFALIRSVQRKKLVQSKIAGNKNKINAIWRDNENVLFSYLLFPPWAQMWRYLKIFTICIFLGRVIGKSLNPDRQKWINGCYEFIDGMIILKTLTNCQVDGRCKLDYHKMSIKKPYDHMFPIME